MVGLTDHVTEFKPGDVVGEGIVGVGEDGDSVTSERLEQIERTVRDRTGGEPKKRWLEFAQEYCRTLGLHNADGCRISTVTRLALPERGTLGDLVKAKQTVLWAYVLGQVGIAGLEHRGYPGITDAAVATDAELVDLPIDGLARPGTAKVKTFRCTVHLLLGETEGGEHVVTEVVVVGTGFFNHGLVAFAPQ